jgi:hypothetical protein
LFAVSSALQRKVWIVVEGRTLFPNTYTLLVGPPGVGKTTAIDYVREIMLKVPAIKMTPSRTTPEKFIEILKTSHKTEISGQSPKGIIPYIHASLAVPLNEFAVFLKPHDIDFMILLTDLFDCPAVWENATLIRGIDRVENCFLTIAGGITPKTINAVFGDKAFGMGFTARLFLIYSEEKKSRPLFSAHRPPEIEDLVADLSDINAIRGEFQMEPAAVEFAETWYAAGMPPLPSDSRFSEYLPRRGTHWLKLSLLVSASRRSTRVITLDDVHFARDLLLEAEEVMPLALESVGQNPMADAIKTIHKWALIRYNTTSKTPIAESQIRRQLLIDIPVQYHLQTIEALVSGGFLSVFSGELPNRLFVPVMKERE